MKPFELVPGEKPRDPEFKPRKGGNYATGSERQSQRIAQSNVEVISDQELDDLRSEINSPVLALGASGDKTVTESLSDQDIPP